MKRLRRLRLYRHSTVERLLRAEREARNTDLREARKEMRALREAFDHATAKRIEAEIQTKRVST